MDRRIRSIDTEPDGDSPIVRGTSASVLDVDDKGNPYGTDLDSYLLKRRIVRLYTDVNEMSMADLQAKFQYLEAKAPDEPIHFYINSPGGSVIAALSAYDTMTGITCPVYTYANGYAASAGSLLFMAGTEGHRYILPNALVMIHQLRGGGSSGPYTDQEIGFRLSKHLEERLEKLYAHHTGRPLRTIEGWMRNGDRWLTAQEAVEHGLADAILDKTGRGTPTRGYTTQDRLQPKPVKASGTRRVRTPSKAAKAAGPKAPQTPPTSNGLDL